MKTIVCVPLLSSIQHKRWLLYTCVLEDLAALVELEERRRAVVLSDAGSAGREGRIYVILVCLYFT